MMDEQSRFSIVCNRCDVSVQVDKRNDPEDRVHCPVCGNDFGSWQDVLTRLPDKHYEPYRDLNSWRITQ